MSPNTRITLVSLGLIIASYLSFTLIRLGEIISVPVGYDELNSFPHPDYIFYLIGEWVEKHQIDPIKTLLALIGSLLLSIVISGVFTAYSGYKLFRFYKPIRGRCPACHYDLTSVTKRQCPECGCTLAIKHMPRDWLAMNRSTDEKCNE